MKSSTKPKTPKKCKNVEMLHINRGEQKSQKMDSQVGSIYTVELEFPLIQFP